MLLKHSRGVGGGGVAFDMGGVRSVKYLVLSKYSVTAY